MIKSSRTLLAIVVLFLATAACADDFALEDVSGKTHHLADYRGKWVLVNFWATWCPPCLNEVPELIALQAAHRGRDLEVIGVALDSTRASVMAFAAKSHINYPLVIGNRKLAEQIGEVEVLPTSYLYAPNGEQVARQDGEVNRADVEAYIKSKKFN